MIAPMEVDNTPFEITIQIQSPHQEAPLVEHTIAKETKVQKINSDDEDDDDDAGEEIEGWP